MDIASLGFSVDSTPLADATAELDALAPAADNAESSSEKLIKTMNKLNSTVNNNVGNTARGVSANDNLAKSYNRVGGAASKATAKIASNDIVQAKNDMVDFGDSMDGVAGKFNPLIFGFRALISGLGLLAVILLANIDHTELLKNGLNKLADILPLIARYAALAAAGLLLVYSPIILKNAVLLPVYILRAAAAMGLFASALAATIGLPILLVAGIVAIVAAANKFRDKLTEIFGFDIVGAAKDGVNKIIGLFVGGFKGIRKVWSSLPAVFGDLMIMTVNRVVENIRVMVNQAITAVNLLNKITGKSVIIPLLPEGTGKIKNKFKGAAATALGTIGDEINNAIGTDYVGNAIAGIDKLSKAAADKLRTFAKTIGVDDKKKTGGGKTDDEKFGDLRNRAGQRIAALTSEIKAVNLSSEAANRLRNETELLNSARQKGIDLTAEQRGEITALAGIMATLQEELKNQRGIKELTTGLERNETALMNELKALNMAGDGLSKFQAETELLAQIKSRDLTLTDEQTEAMLEQARAVSVLKDKIDNLKGFEDLNTGLEESISSLKVETQLIGMVGAGAEALRAETALMAAIKQKDVTLTDEQTESLKKLAAEQAKIVSANDNLKYFTDRNNALRESAALTNAETLALGMNKEAASALLFETQLLNDEKFRGIQLSADQRAELIANNNQLIQSQSALQKMREGLDFARQTAGSFFDDLFGGLKQGASVWDAFKNTVINALDTIVNKLLDNVIQSLVNQLLPTGGAGGGFIGFLGSLFGGSFAKGAAFNASGVSKFAKGGAFTNSIVSRPTLFKFARGGQLGEMGEAGPEAVMPLKRGANGSLGVQMFGRPSANDNGRARGMGDVSMPIHIHGIRDSKGVKKAASTVGAETANALRRANRSL